MRAVHLHPVQLTPAVVETVRSYGLVIHTFEVDDEVRLRHVMELGIRRVCTDRVQSLCDLRRTMQLDG